MAKETKGFLGGNMNFNVSDEGAAVERAPLLPLRIVVVADLVPRDPHNAGASPPATAVRVDPTQIDKLFATLRPRIAIDVPSVLLKGRTTRIDLAPTSLKSFRPDGLCADIPLLRSLLDARLVLDRLRDGSIAQDYARAELDRLWNGSPFVHEIFGLLPSPSAQSAAASSAKQPAPGDSSSVDAILNMVDLGGGGAEATPGNDLGTKGTGSAGLAPEPSAPPNRFSEIIATVAQSAKRKAGQPVRPNEALAHIERALGAQIGAILQHPEVRRLEEAWRGVNFLCERVKLTPGVKLDVISARPDDAAKVLEDVLNETRTTDAPASFAIVDVVVDGTPLGFSRLEAIAKVAESHTMPTLVQGSEKLLGVEKLGEVERLDNKGALFSAPHRAPWRSAAAKHAMRWVSIVGNRIVARAPYDKSTSRIREAAIVETPNDEGGYVWLSPVFAIGTLVIKSFRDTTWPCRIIGAREGLVEDLPVHHVRTGYEGDEDIAIPTETFISTDTQKAMAKSGVMLLASAPNSDAAYVLTAPTAYVPPEKRTYDSATTEPEDRLERVSLVDQLFVGRVVQFLQTLCSKVPATGDVSELQSVIEGALWALFENAPPASIELHAKVQKGQDGPCVAITIRPRRFLGVSLEEFSLELPLG